MTTPPVRPARDAKAKARAPKGGFEMWQAKRVLIASSVFISAASPALADTDRTTSGLAIFITWLPMLIFLVFAVFYFRYFRGAISRMKRWQQHMDRVEQLLERIVSALEGKERDG